MKPPCNKGNIMVHGLEVKKLVAKANTPLCFGCFGSQLCQLQGSQHLCHPLHVARVRIEEPEFGIPQEHVHHFLFKAVVVNLAGYPQ